MDKTAEYIFMCRQALQIQEAFKTDKKYFTSHNGHFISWRYKDEPDNYEYVEVLGKKLEYDWQRDFIFTPGIGRGSHLKENYREMTNYDWVWLPRLDQLIDMLSGNYNSKFTRLHLFCYGTGTLNGIYEAPPLFTFESPEQLALGLVMYDNYNKVWDDNNWIDFIK